MVFFLAGAAVSVLGSLAKTTVEGLAPEFLAKGRVQLAKQSFRRKLAVYKMNIEQQKLFREDIRDLVELSVGRMDVYHLVGALLLGFSITLYTKNPFLLIQGTDGAEDVPSWAVSLFLISNMGATGYLVLGTWFSMHASVASHSIGVRLLTRFARLSIPGKAELEEVTQVHMLPLLGSRGQELGSAGALDEGLEALEDQECHLRRYRHEQRQWLSYDAHARVCMCLGILQVIQALCYYLIGRSAGTAHRSTVPSLIGLQALAFTLQRLDERSSSAAERVVALFLGQLAPVLVGFLAWLSHSGTTMKGLLVLAFMLHGFSVLFSAHRFELFGTGSLSQLPRRLRTVFYLDVVGVTCHSEGEGRMPSAATPPEELPRSLMRRFACVLALLWFFAAIDPPLRRSDEATSTPPQLASSLVKSARCGKSPRLVHVARSTAKASTVDAHAAMAAAPHTWGMVAAAERGEEEVALVGWDGARIVVARAVQSSRSDTWTVSPRFAVGRGEHFQKVVGLEFGPEGHTLAVLHAGGNVLDSWDLVHGARLGRWEFNAQNTLGSCDDGHELKLSGREGEALGATVAATDLQLGERMGWW